MNKISNERRKELNDTIVEELMENDNFIKLLEKEFLKTDYGMQSLDDDLEDNFDRWLNQISDDYILEFAETINLLTDI